MQVGLDKLSFSKLQSQALVQGLTNIAELLFLTSSSYFQSAAARADGMLIPNLHKALFVSCNPIVTL
jgi:hypothetical protein